MQGIYTVHACIMYYTYQQNNDMHAGNFDNLAIN